MNTFIHIACIAMLIPCMALAQVSQYTAGDSVSIVLTAKDGSGNIITDWDQTGTNAILTLHNSTANTDTSNRSWNADPIGYSWAMVYHDGQPLTQISDYQWNMPPALFTDGTAELTFVHTKSTEEAAFTMSIDDTSASFKIAPNSINFVAGPITNFLVHLVSSIPDSEAVYNFRKYEIFVCPRDRYLNVTNEQIRTRFTARIPGEFANSLPSFSDVFSGDVFIRGSTNFFLASTKERIKGVDTLQWLSVTAGDDSTVTGRTSEYEIRPHAPSDFNLLLPVDGTILTYNTWTTPYEFSWEEAPDPYTNILISIVCAELGNDVVDYTIHILDSASLTKRTIRPSDNNKRLNKWTTTHGELRSIVESQPDTVSYHAMIWYVEATDGLYVTQSNDPHPGIPQIGNRLSVYIPNPDNVERIAQAATSFLLHQNYPNPFNPSTTIRFEIVERGHVTLRVYDLLGNQVAELANETLDPGAYSTEFNAVGLASGVYTYILQTRISTLTKRMIVEK